jgi:poly-gamma-glutamate synthesis protein (capsule biosynthesis protein)
MIEEIESRDREIVLAFAGDVVCKRKEGVKISQELKEKLEMADVFSVNLEAPLEGYGMPIKKAGSNLNQSESVVDSLKNIGVNVVASANNHICDYGKLALEYALDKLKDFITVGAGTDFDKSYQLKIINVNGGGDSWVPCFRRKRIWSIL